MISVYTTTDGRVLYQISTTGSTIALCPDRLRYDQIGEADGWRGRVVRAFFWLMRVWPPR